MNTQLLIGLCILAGALLLDIIATAIPYWLVANFGGTETNIGLFQTCVEVLGSRVCASSSNQPDWWKATQAMMILSILSLAAAVGLAVMFCFIMKDKQVLGLFGAFMGIAGAALAILGVIIFGSKSSDAFGDLHAGFGLAIVAAIIAFVGSLLIFVSRNKSN